MSEPLIQQYKEYVAGRLAEISPLLQKYALGDFSESIDIPEEDDEFTELLVAIGLMVDDLRELVRRDADRTRRIAARVNQMIESVMKVARGDFSVQVELSEGDDDLNALAKGLNMMADDIRTAVGETERERAYVSGIVASMADALIVVDPDATIRTVNEAARKLLGYGEDELVGQPVAMVSRGTSLLADDTLSELRDKGYIKDIETDYIGKDKEAIPVSLSAAIMRDSEGELAGIVCVARDLRQMKQLIERDRERVAELEKAYGELEAGQEASLNIMEDLDMRGKELCVLTARLEGEIAERRRAEEELRVKDTAIASSISAIALADLEGNLSYVNDSFLGLWGYDALEEVLGHPVLAFWEGETKATEVVQALATRGSWVGELVASRKDGSSFDTQLSANIVADESGQPICMMASFMDITERKEAEQQLQRYAEELEQRNQEIRNFAYIVSHDFRAPLVNLKGFSAELRSALQVIDAAMPTVQPHLDEVQRKAVAIALQEDVPEALGFIESSVTRMDKYISAVLRLSRLGRRELSLQPLDVEGIVRDALDGLAHQVAEHQAEVVVGALPQVVADRTSMEQIMGNLLSNAVKYLEPHRPGKIEILGERRDGEAVFEIRDNGRGIGAEDMDKIFMPFRRVGRQDIPGEGMGLSYVRTMVRRHGGQIRCDSELGEGTVFTFTISDHLAEADDA